ncbi:type II secretion system secretin GspD [Luteimonas sp. 50]|uniref:Type II secretion system secretin GspD n=1 Tax=Cognatiluteimonas sedimenti TaxID=2927791 RepID=A0ABT0A3V7_9GAMM|nr:type II secretion system secretin GspD [Lysobacter sedimenti]MCJ0825662.1 type II secretion system secretin GspD [Lysobacter sedimenti]
MNLRPQLKAVLAATLASLLAACASMSSPVVQRSQARAPAVQPSADAASPTGNDVRSQVLPAEDAGPQPIIRRGTGQVINRGAAAAPLPNLVGTTGAATFNFEGESLQAVVKAILGDMLGQNYVIAPGVQGTVTLATPHPVSPAEARSLLEMVLGWNNARMVYSDGRYNIVPSDQALAGTVAPRTGSAASARGFESRVVPLRYISAAEMEKVLKPYARPNAIVNVDSGRNLITLAGTRAELENYLRTVEIFDVDWMSSMSVGVFPLQSGKATKVVADLEKVFGEQSKSPVAGMFRFMPLEGANAVLVITPQADYLDDIQQWLQRIDSAGEGVQLFSYELKYVKAKDLADRLAEVFGGGGGRSDNGGAPSLMPGLQSTQIKDGGIDDTASSAQVGGDSGGGGLGDGSLSLDPRQSGNGAVMLEVDGDKVGVSAVDETNTLLVRATGQAWRSIRDVIERLDVMPLQVHIEAQVAEVKLSGALQYGVNWYFEQAVNATPANGGAGLPSAAGRTIWGDLAGSIRPAGGVNPGLAWTFLGRNAAAVINALDEVTDVRLLQTPSVVVRNNAEAVFNVGSRIPISSVTFNPNSGSDGNTFSQVQYLDTGTILKVRPRITRDGTVFLDLVQEISTPGSLSSADPNGNVRIDTRRLKTEAAIQSGDTIMLAGLISDGVDRGSSGVPGLSRIPVIGGLFGTQRSGTSREEVIVLLTATVLRNPLEARDLTDEYGRRFRAMEPLYRTPKQR